MFALPADEIATLPFAAGILTLLVPFANIPTKLPAVILLVTANELNIPKLVMFPCAAVVNVPAMKFAVNRFPAFIFPAVMLPFADTALDITTVPVPLGDKLILPFAPVIIDNSVVSTIFPVKFRLPPVILPVAVKVLADITLAPVMFPPEPVVVIDPPVVMLPNVPLPVAVTEPVVTMLPAVILPVAVIKPAVPKFPTLALPVALNAPPVVKLPPVTLPVAIISPAVPKLPTLALPVTFDVVAKIPVVPKLPTLALPVALILPAVVILPPDILPVTVIALVVLSNVNPLFPAIVPESLNSTCVLLPTVMLPEIFPTTLPLKKLAETLPEKFAFPVVTRFPNFTVG